MRHHRFLLTLLVALALASSACSVFYLHDPNNRVTEQQMVAMAEQSDQNVGFGFGGSTPDTMSYEEIKALTIHCGEIHTHRSIASSMIVTWGLAAVASAAVHFIEPDLGGSRLAAGVTIGTSLLSLGSWQYDNYQTREYVKHNCKSYYTQP